MLRLFQYYDITQYRDFPNYLFSLRDNFYVFDFANDMVTIEGIQYRISPTIEVDEQGYSPKFLENSVNELQNSVGQLQNSAGSCLVIAAHYDEVINQAGGSDTILYQSSIPSGLIAVNGDSLIIRYFGNYVSNSTLKVKFNNFPLYSKNFTPTQAGNFAFELEIILIRSFYGIDSCHSFFKLTFGDATSEINRIYSYIGHSTPWYANNNIYLIGSGANQGAIMAGIGIIEYKSKKN